MKIRTILGLGVVAVALTGVANATPVYVGSWDKNSGPFWPDNPLAYSGVGAAELLFGAGNYYISTVDSDPNHINHMAYYDVIGIGVTKFSENYFRGTEGVTHYMDVWDFGPNGPNVNTVSAYVHDNGSGINYAFRVDSNSAPDGGSTVALLGVAFTGLAAVRRKKSA